MQSVVKLVVEHKGHNFNPVTKSQNKPASYVSTVWHSEPRIIMSTSESTTEGYFTLIKCLESLR